MLKYLETVKTGAPENNLRIVVRVNYFYETTTNIMYMQGEYEGNFIHTDPLMPMIKSSGEYLTHEEWEQIQLHHNTPNLIDEISKLGIK